MEWTIDELTTRFFAREDISTACPVWADGGTRAGVQDGGAFAPGQHRLAALPDLVDRVRVDDLEPGALVDWLASRLPDPGADDALYAVLLSYDAGRNLERIPATAREEPALPDVIIARYPAWLECEGIDGPVLWRGEAQDRERLKAWIDGWSPAPLVAPSSTELRSPMGREAHRRAVENVLEGIAAGDLYQANVARRLEGEIECPQVHELYQRLRQASPPAFGGLWHLERGLWLASISPERLLTWDPSKLEAHSYPIKGTRPRGANADEDRRLAHELSQDPKERAEHVMIVDLVRNDLGRVAVPGGVSVERLAEVQRLPTVHHLVSDVRAQIRPDVRLADLLAAVFPGGSITGAPKIAAMARIEEVEGLRRGFYTGSLGFVEGATGRATFNILIRTAVVVGGRLLYQTGGGIVADSDPEREWAETGLKAAALQRALADARPDGNA